jgi:hypothetical protein
MSLSFSHPPCGISVEFELLMEVVRLRLKGLGRVTALALAFAAVALAQTVSWANPTNVPPPVGAILDLSGTPVPGGGNSTYQHYTVNFLGALTSTDITFAFREDPAFLFFTDASVTDLSHPSGNLLTNGNFQGGTFTSNGNSQAPVGWTYANVFGATFGGVVDTACPAAPSGNTSCWVDGAVQAYDAIDQFIPTTVGDNYQVSFQLADDSACNCNFSDVSTNGDVTGTGGNGINLTVYAQAGLPSLPSATPEPNSLVLLGTGVLGLVGAVRRKFGR